MSRIHTHYDNLKVTRNAPPEVIRAAYKTLCQKFHPDRNPGSESAKNTFLLIRTAYETLSDPEKRKLHDAWIASAEAAQNLEIVVSQPRTKSGRTTLEPAQTTLLRRKKRVWQVFFWLMIGLLVLIGFLY